KVPIIDLTMGDLRIWAANGEGLYSVKSAYKIIMTQVFYLSDFKIPRDWNCVWKLSVPPRMQTLIWRLARECLPTRANIKAKGVACSLLRPLCEIVVETAFRTFFACQTNIGCWNYADGALVVARTMWREPCMQARRRSMGNSTSA
ncbi:Putative ribonuclease H protein, partial [Glycine soja]